MDLLQVGRCVCVGGERRVLKTDRDMGVMDGVSKDWGEVVKQHQQWDVGAEDCYLNECLYTTGWWH